MRCQTSISVSSRVVSRPRLQKQIGAHVVQSVDRAELGDGAIYQFLRRLLVGEVEFDGDRPAAGLGDPLGGGLGPPTAADVLAAPLLAGLSATFPKVSFQVTVASTDQLVEGMLKGAVDVAMINPVPDDRMFYRDLLIEDLVVVGGPASDLQANNPMSFAELVDLPLVLPSSPTSIGNTVENTASRLFKKLRSRFADRLPSGRQGPR